MIRRPLHPAPSAASVLRSLIVSALGVGALHACGGELKGNSAAPGGRAGGTGPGGAGGRGLLSGGHPSLTDASTGGAAEGGAGGRAVTEPDAFRPPDADADAALPFVCRNPVPVTAVDAGPGGPSGGFVRCEDGTVQRPTTGECWSNLGALDAGSVFDGPDGGSVECRTHADCVEHLHGQCIPISAAPSPWPYGTQCVYGCMRDAECQPGFICRCGEPVGACVPSECVTDGDCGEGVACQEARSWEFCTGESVRFTCGPECRTDADCESSVIASWLPKCVDAVCQVPPQPCGRPFLIEGRPRVAPVMARADWSGGAAAPDLAHLSDASRHELARHYQEAGLLEHASVAAFARFTLQLLALGAPKDLVELAGAALADEIEHALLCFGLASAYAGAPRGPGPLDIAGAVTAGSLENELESAFIECCLGETTAALDAALSRDLATDPAVVAALTRIADDEARHAVLGWRFLAWGLGRLEDAPRRALLERLAGRLDVESRALRETAAGAHDDRLTAHGLPSGARRTATRATALADVVRPCLAVV